MLFNSASESSECSDGGPIRESCVHPGQVANALRIAPAGFFPVGSQITYTCDFGYQPQGPATITCLDRGYWSHVPPDCTCAYLYTTHMKGEIF